MENSFLDLWMPGVMNQVSLTFEKKKKPLILDFIPEERISLATVVETFLSCHSTSCEWYIIDVPNELWVQRAIYVDNVLILFPMLYFFQLCFASAECKLYVEGLKRDRLLGSYIQILFQSFTSQMCCFTVLLSLVSIPRVWGLLL